jgi:hypothetical protein
MTPLAIVGISLCVGWAILWFSLGRQVRGQAELEKKVEALERQK